MVQEVARQMVEQNGRAALRIIHGLIEHAVKTDDYWNLGEMSRPTFERNWCSSP
jgi:hypothetical protein